MSCKRNELLETMMEPSVLQNTSWYAFPSTYKFGSQSRYDYDLTLTLNHPTWKSLEEKKNKFLETTLGHSHQKTSSPDIQNLANAGSWLGSCQNQTLPFLLHVSKGLGSMEEQRWPCSAEDATGTPWLQWIQISWHTCNLQRRFRFKSKKRTQIHHINFVGLFEPSIQDGQDLHLIWCLFFVPGRNQYSKWTEFDGSSIAHFDFILRELTFPNDIAVYSFPKKYT